MFATLHRVRPEGVRCASTRVVDSSTFVASYNLFGTRHRESAAR